MEYCSEFAVISILRLSRKYGDERLEAACAHALPRLSHPRYRHLKAILDSRLDCEAERRPKRPAPAGEGGHLRGADYYRD